MAHKPLKIGVVMDPIGSITPKKDSTLAMLLEAARRSAEIHYFEQKDLKLLSGKAIGQSTRLTVRDNLDDWFDFGATCLTVTWRCSPAVSPRRWRSSASGCTRGRPMRESKKSLRAT